MDTLLPLLATAALWALGYRFYARLVAGALPGAFDQYSTPPSGAGERTDQWLSAARPAAAALAWGAMGACAALVYGWGSAVMWIALGAVLAGGVQNLGAHWRARHLEAAPLQRLEQRAGTLARLIALLALVLAGAWLLLLAATLLKGYPAAAPALLLAILAAPVLAPRSAAARSLSLLVLWPLAWGLGALLPLTLQATVQLEIGPASTTVDGLALWLATLALAAYLLTAPRRGAAGAQLARTAVAGGALLAAALLLALLIEHPSFELPRHNTNLPPDLPGAWPWIVFLVSAGAVSGVEALLIGAPAAAARGSGRAAFGVALFAAAGALLTALAVAGGFPTLTMAEQSLAPVVQMLAGQVTGASGLMPLLSVLVQGTARLLAVFGPPVALWEGAIAAVLVVAAVAGMQHCAERAAATARELRARHALLKRCTAPLTPRAAVSLATLGLALPASGAGALLLLPLAGAANLLASLLVLAWTLLALRASGRSAWPVAAPLLVLGLLWTWGVVMATGSFLLRGHLLPGLIGVLLIGLGGSLAVVALHHGRKLPP